MGPFLGPHQTKNERSQWLVNSSSKNKITSRSKQQKIGCTFPDAADVHEFDAWWLSALEGRISLQWLKDLVTNGHRIQQVSFIFFHFKVINSNPFTVSISMYHVHIVYHIYIYRYTCWGTCSRKRMKTAGTSITSSFSLKRSFKRRLRERKFIQSCTIKKKAHALRFFATIACSKETWEMFSSIGKRLPYTKQIKLWKLHAEIRILLWTWTLPFSWLSHINHHPSIFFGLTFYGPGHL